MNTNDKAPDAGGFFASGTTIELEVYSCNYDFQNDGERPAFIVTNDTLSNMMVVRNEDTLQAVLADEGISVGSRVFIASMAEAYKRACDEVVNDGVQRLHRLDYSLLLDRRLLAAVTLEIQ